MKSQGTTVLDGKLRGRVLDADRHLHIVLVGRDAQKAPEGAVNWTDKTFERLRDRSDAHRAKAGTRPKVFLACLGRPADFNARASFAKSLFESGGIEGVEGKGENLAKRFKESGARLACLCSSDQVYEREAADVAKALAEAGATHIYLAGKPGPNRSALEKAGVSTFLHPGYDTLEILTAAYDEI